jgi:hypothetical protein
MAHSSSDNINIDFFQIMEKEHYHVVFDGLQHVSHFICQQRGFWLH